ncbi:hypothetical protein A3K29_05660 [Candidatus Collierbacteria bacterium RIFOXYB2_FULL_46_14]|uniref:Methyltransferase FkbM family n=1 Tax=Candidatus Collierbacteria bacterium GW2011_GWA2_46_26 TaxID=1618381 RepID=A0A0G1SGZ9_9BACT|nr:MAG: Methyltransferase FkbM family [Candidatus Collierbacteria bacterium GW2011_GWA2_46_26]OGD73575.1 MAG: hypothetical protein A3K29_05660 [Candidatus Collierbacteria bacterium RIFOXYB2_FULL_46_14]OGD76617.1 MAG: hypothetical protein A3K43_05660 [Candidatus Collierbacteria bacterium RIFOXYA2_FULL_46_20]OGD77953.1 MAG: hypothetical protein A3K39_05660 [Candidatus Collierbacteria bacterium RIFOXYC2_FULL_43_15]OGD79977.1 MAG: hypothetical protein A2320_00090 [Pseudomonadales bacterium GWC2_63_
MDWKQKLLVSPLYDLFGKRSYAQSGEDLIAWGEFKNSINQKLKKSKLARGFYVDIGAYHPKLFSNTYLFYKKGWRGICVDPNPQMEKLYGQARPRDIFVNVGVGDGSKNQNQDEGGVMEYFMFEDGAANTFSAEQARKNQKEAGRKLVGKRIVDVLPLREILEKYIPKGQKIVLLSVDAEGMDVEVLKSNDWKKYRPELIICEDLEFDFKNWKKSEVTKYLVAKGYELKAKTPYSLIFKRVE